MKPKLILSVAAGCLFGIITLLIGRQVVGVFGQSTPTTLVSAQVPSATVSASPSSSLLPAFRAQRLRIPVIQVNAAIETVGLDVDNNMDVPVDDHDVGLYKYGPVPGDVGSAVMDGHLDTPTRPSVFAKLKLLRAGDEIVIDDESGQTRTFRVDHLTEYPNVGFPIDTVFAQTSERHLNLITCSGHFDHSIKQYDHRLVVFAVAK